MTQQINLYDGLEALYYFDEDYYDGTANEIKDKSGHGRHAQASGGPTIGVEGPDSFEAASFDRVDDVFNNPITSWPTSELTVTAIMKPVNYDSDAKVIVGTRNQAVGPISSGAFQYQMRIQHDDDTVTNADYIDDENKDDLLDTWGVYTGTYSATDGARTFVNGEFHDQAPSESSGIFIKENISVGARPDGGFNFGGDIAMVMLHSRTISQAEIEYLNRLTAPRRAQL